MAETSWFCEHCELEIRPASGEKPRCPGCMRTTGLTRLDPASGPPRRIPLGAVLGGAAIALALGGLLWFLLREPGAPGAGSDTAPAPGTTVVEPGTAPPPAPAPQLPREEPPATSEVVAALAARLSGGATSPAEKVFQVMEALHQRLEAVPEDRPLGRDVLDAAAAAGAIGAADAGNGDGKVGLTGLEAGALVLQLLRALGLDAHPVVLLEPQAGRTSIRRRAIGVRVDGAGVKGLLAPLRSARPVEDALVHKDEQVSPVEPLLDGLRAVRLLEQSRVDEAAALVTSAIAKLPGDQALRFLRGQIHMMRGETAGGLQELQKAVVSAEDAEGRFDLAVALLTDEQTFRAFQELRRAVELFPKHARAWSALGQLTLGRLQASPEEQRPALNEELDAIVAGMAAIGNDAPGLVELRVQRLRLAGKTEEARDLAVEALNLFPERAALHLQMAEMALEANEEAAAQRHLERAAEADPYDAEPLLRLATLHAERDEQEKALDALGKAVERAPFDPGLLAQLGAAKLEAGKPEEAAEVSAKLRARFPKLTSGWLLMAQAHLANEQEGEAVRVLEEGIAAHPKATELYSLLFLLHTAGKRQKEAGKALERLLAVDPDGRLKLAEPLLQAGLWEAGVTLLEGELAANPDKLQIATTLAQLHTAGKNDEAVTRLRKHVASRAPAEQREQALKTFDDAVAEIEKQLEAEKAPPEGEGDPGEAVEPHPDGEQPESLAPKAAPDGPRKSPEAGK